MKQATKGYQLSLGAPLCTVQFWRQTVKSVLLYGFCTNLCCAQADVILSGNPEYKIGALWVGYYLKTKKYEKYDTENAENDSGAPGEWKMNWISPLMR